MLLTSSAGPLVDLSVTGYQFPQRVATSAADWDANWLCVHGNVTQAEGKSWAFKDPCLTTWEGQALANWLREAAAGIVHFSLEALPPWLRGPQQPDIFDFVILLRRSVSDLADAADAWARDLAKYPER